MSQQLETIRLEPSERETIPELFYDQIIRYDCDSFQIVHDMFGVVTPYKDDPNITYELSIHGIDGIVTLKHGDKIVIRKKDDDITLTKITKAPKELYATPYKYMHQVDYAVVEITDENIELFKEQMREAIDSELKRIKVGCSIITPLLYNADKIIRTISDSELEQSYEQLEY